MLKNMKLSTRLGAGFAIVVLLMSLIVATGLYGVGELQKRLDDIVNDNLTKMHALYQMSDAVNNLEGIIANTVVTGAGDESQQQKILQSIKDTEAIYEKALKNIQGEKTAADEEDLLDKEAVTLKQLAVAAAGAHQINERVISLVFAGQQAEARGLYTKEAFPLNIRWQTTLKDLLAVHEEDNRIDSDAARELSETMPVLLLSISAVTIILALIIGIWLTRSLTRRITPMVEFAGQMALGEFPVPLMMHSQDEVGQLSESLNALRSSFLSVMQQTQRIARGEYTVAITPRSEKDELVIAFAGLTDALRQTTARNQQENWIRTGQTEFNDRLRGETDLIALAQNALTFLAEYVNAQVGALYLREEDESLHMVGSYAYTRRKNLVNVFRLGEGLVGQAALEKKPIVVTNVPDDYITISSGVGESIPSSLVVIPLIDREVVEGVLELGSFHPLTEASLTLFSHLTGMLASVLNAARSRAQVEKLLRTTQAQAEELQTQQAALQATNARLEDRGRERPKPSPPSEPCRRFSRTRLSSRWCPHRDWRAATWASC
ncbi:MAG: GAF domain-containing protein, partial [Deltaproteobacteria bacterium]|nr:GAF domain-containing protein [Deltaproteobacteria bacterium]